MKKYNANSGWFSESRRHSLASKGIKTGRKTAQLGVGLGKMVDYASAEETLKNLWLKDKDAIEAYEFNGKVIRIYTDENPDSPREWDNLGHMVAFHKRYTLGDKTDLDSDQFDSWESMADYLIKDENAVVILPIYLYDHSGLRMKVGSFSGLLPQGHAEFDSGQVGFVYVTKDELAKASKSWDKGWKNKYHKGKSNKQIAEDILKGEVETYDQYLSGDVYGFDVSDPKTGESIERVFGFYGMDEAKKEAESVASYIPQVKIPLGQKQLKDFARPSKVEVKKFFKTAFGHEPRKDYYFSEWVGRFDSPRRVWSSSDYERRTVLKKMYPKKFGSLDVDVNLNNPEYQTKQYSDW
jgi:hypothetical protein